jgi:hypothetical protein
MIFIRLDGRRRRVTFGASALGLLVLGLLLLALV